MTLKIFATYLLFLPPILPKSENLYFGLYEKKFIWNHCQSLISANPRLIIYEPLFHSQFTGCAQAIHIKREANSLQQAITKEWIKKFILKLVRKWEKVLFCGESCKIKLNLGNKWQQVNFLFKKKCSEVKSNFNFFWLWVIKRFLLFIERNNLFKIKNNFFKISINYLILDLFKKKDLHKHNWFRNRP